MPNILCFENNTLLGLTADVRYIFINERLASIEIIGHGGSQNSVKNINLIVEPLKQRLQEPTESKLKITSGKDWDLYFMEWNEDVSKSSFKIGWRTLDRENYQSEVGSWDVLISKPEVIRLYDDAVKQSRVDTDNFINSKSKKDF